MTQAPQKARRPLMGDKEWEAFVDAQDTIDALQKVYGDLIELKIGDDGRLLGFFDGTLID